MIIWVDAQLSPALAPWIAEHFGLKAFSLKYLGMQTATDREIFDKARREGAALMTKDSDFVRLIEALGPPPRVLLVTLGNTSNSRMKEALKKTLREAIALLDSGEILVEIRDSAVATD
jgi:predicted nuclease of predicted toxin-antitoxin system